jgi:hypothetical protein
MKTRIIVLTMLVAALVMTASAADVNGQWKTTFMTPMGPEHYVFTFTIAGTKVTGTAKSDRGPTPIQDGLLKGDVITFTEVLSAQGQKIPMKYTGKVGADEIKFQRLVGNFGKDDFVAKRLPK